MQEYVFGPDGPKLKLISPDGAIVKELHLDNDGNLTIQAKTVKVGGSNEITVALADASRPYVRNTSVTYKTITYFPFGGSDRDGVPSAIKVVSNSGSSGKTYDVKIIRSATGDVVAELLGSDNEEVELKDLGALSNIPTGPEILEIQSRVQNGGESRISAITIQF